MQMKKQKLLIRVGVPTILQTSMLYSVSFFTKHRNVDWIMAITMKTVVCRRAPPVYVNLFTGQATTQFPSVTETARGGVSLF